MSYALLACDPLEPDELEESVEGLDDDPESDDFEDPESEEPEDEPEPESDDPELEPECSFSFDAPFFDDRLSVL
ncbi:MAG: hypothetical protein QOE62_2674 [Actinomycetota bacterium]|nr:hypothetical protein [Actinomycetota bacterium]